MRLRSIIHGLRAAPGGAGLEHQLAPRHPVSLLGPVPDALPADVLAVAPLSERLCARLSAESLDAIAAAADDEQRAVLAGALAKDQPWVRLAIGLHHGIEAVASETGLSPASPPDDVHAMGRGWLATGGSYGHAELVVDALARAGVTLQPGMTGLDFGCSSGRVVRVLHAAEPGTRWLACDPNEGAIGWASSALPGIEFFVSPLRPPLPLDDASLDVAFAISIWSHFDEGPALAWFDEMHRLVRPRGVVVFTTHGRQSLVHYLETGERSVAQLEETASGLLARAYWYHPEYADFGDHGVVDTGWGTAFMSAEWVLTHLTDRWDVVSFHRGRDDHNQDLYVLRHRP